MINEIDLRILNILQQDARISNAEIARQLDMAPSAILERIRKLETRGLIQGYEARLNPKMLALDLLAFIFVRAEESLSSMNTGDVLAQMPEVQEVHHPPADDPVPEVARRSAQDQRESDGGRVDPVARLP